MNKPSRSTNNIRYPILSCKIFLPFSSHKSSLVLGISFFASPLIR